MVGDEEYMERALTLAKEAYFEGEVPVGCVIVRDGEIIASGKNSVIGDGCALSHAEINAVREAAKNGFKYLSDCAAYVTVEPCAMCAGAFINARLGELIYGVREPKSGCCGSNYMLTADSRFNHAIEVRGGISEAECKNLMEKFFADRREKC